jgi:AcrR family transcriptional regulator
MTRRLTQRGAERRRQLMDYAAARFAEKGYHPTSVAEIVQGLGVGKGVFYWYFSSKEELLLEILKDAQHDLRVVQQQAIADEPDPIKRIELGIRSSLAWSERNRNLQTIVQFASTEERFAPALRRGQDVAVDDASKHIKEAMAEGKIADADPVALSHAVIGVTTHLSRTYLHERGEPAADVADLVVAFCLDGLGRT